jgi:branched-subunit amino acid transport protein
VSWQVVALLGAVCFTLRAGAPLALRSRALPRALQERLEGAVVPLLAALCAVQLFTARGSWTIDGRAAGVAVGAGVFLARRSLPLALVAAAAATSAVRLL